MPLIRMNYLTSIAKTWNSLNPATLSGAIDVIVIEDEHGNLSCSPFHIRFGKFQLLRPSQKKVNFKVNGLLTNIHMKLGDGGEAFFVFQTSESSDRIPDDMMTSPVVSAASSAVSSPLSSPKSEPLTLDEEPDYLDLDLNSAPNPDPKNSSEPALTSAKSSANQDHVPGVRKSATMSSVRSLSPSRAQKLSEQLTMKNIPTKIDSNGELVLDISGYKASEQDIQSYDNVVRDLLKEEFGAEFDLSGIVKYDAEGNVRIYSAANETDPTLEAQTLLNAPLIEEFSAPDASDTPPATSSTSGTSSFTSHSDSINYIKTLRLTSDQLMCLNLKYGANDMEFTVDQTKSTVTSRIFLWKYNVPVVISDIDGTITKSDALGHVFNMIGKDWTHLGVAKLFSDIELNGYNIMYLTARSVGLADTTRAYLNGIEQEGVKLPVGPVILSPDRTMAALRREVILKKPEVFKITCLKDLQTLYGQVNKTPFYAGFGNRITDALSYRSVDIPSSRIFTINTDGDVHLELLELAGYKSSYIHINELVDHFFPPVNIDLLSIGDKKDGANVFIDENFTDTVYWRDPIPDFSDSDEEAPLEKDQAQKPENQPHNAPVPDPSIAGNKLTRLRDHTGISLLKSYNFYSGALDKSPDQDGSETKADAPDNQKEAITPPQRNEGLLEYELNDTYDEENDSDYLPSEISYQDDYLNNDDLSEDEYDYHEDEESSRNSDFREDEASNSKEDEASSKKDKNDAAANNTKA